MANTIFHNIFSITPETFSKTTWEIFHFQHQNNHVYNQWCKHLTNDAPSSSVNKFPPFLPIAFFKSHKVVTTAFEPAFVFESSGTTQTINSKHFIKDLFFYEESFLKAFQLFYGNVADWCIIGLLPSYLERNNSSLVMMVDALIKASKNTQSGFYLDNYTALHKVLLDQEAKKQPTLVIGVTFALLDFAKQFPIQLKHTTIMETGGMKGRRKELTRAEVHQKLYDGLGITKVHSEYGMTELLSQAYSKGDGIFYCPPWMKVVVRTEDDPLDIRFEGRGVLNIIDLANVYSCSFIATDDVGIVYPDGSFEVWGRLDNSDIRGCSLLVV